MSVTNLSSTAHNEVLLAMDDYKLPKHFYRTVEDFYLPVAHGIASSFANAPRVGDSAKPDHVSRVIGIQGSQGSGKSTCAAFLKLLLEIEFGRKTLVTSIDDFYLTRDERLALAKRVHPLLATRGVPATHDTGLLKSLIDNVRLGKPYHVPVFDKSIDDRAPEEFWQRSEDTVDVLIIEGWCVGVSAQSEDELKDPVNELERIEDSNLEWRTHVNQALARDYAEVFSQLDMLIALQAPSFECVLGWRSLQEQKMIVRLEAQGKDTSRALTADQLARFIAHYQRLTEHALRTMPERADYLLTLNENHAFEKLNIADKADIARTNNDD